MVFFTLFFVFFKMKRCIFKKAILSFFKKDTVNFLWAGLIPALSDGQNSRPMGGATFTQGGDGEPAQGKQSCASTKIRFPRPTLISELVEVQIISCLDVGAVNVCMGSCRWHHLSGCNYHRKRGFPAPTWRPSKLAFFITRILISQLNWPLGKKMYKSE